MTKHLDSDQSLHRKLLSGVNKLADNVAATLGPKGRNVILQGKNGIPVITKDGVTVANFLNLECPFENVGAQIIKQAASQTNTTAGDGTTTSTVLARAILDKSQKYLATGASPIELKRGMDKATDEIVYRLSEMAKPVTSIEDIQHVATISANGDESIGKLISMAVDQVGKDGAISLEEAKSEETSLDVVEGFRFDSGYFANAFVNNERKNSIEYNNALVMVTDQKIELVEDILPILEVVAREGRPFVIVAESVEGQALAALIMNTVRGSMKVAAVKAPRYGQERRNIMHDLATSVGATFITRESGISLKEAKLENLGKCKRIEVLKNFTTIVGGEGDLEEIEEKIALFKEQFKEETDNDLCEKIQERIVRLASGVAIIKVGAPTEIEMIEKKHRIEDALEAVRSAQAEGIVPGGGTSLLRATRDLEVDVTNEDQRIGVEIIKQAVLEPIKQMAENAGQSPDLIVTEVSACAEGLGWDFSNGFVVDMISEGIIDPVKVTRTALQNAVSVSSTLITTSNAIIET